jgi:predicted MFS family arabinose efflux permease
MRSSSLVTPARGRTSADKGDDTGADTSDTSDTVDALRVRLGGGTGLLVAAMGLYSFNFSLLISTVPVIAHHAGGSAGLVNAILLGMTVCWQFATPVLRRRLSDRTLYVAALAFMGAPTLIYVWAADAVGAVYVASAIRGAGFGILTVIGSAMIIERAPRERHGRTVGQLGIATGVPGIFGPPLGLSLLHSRAPDVPNYLGFVVCAAGIVLILRIPSAAARPRSSAEPDIDLDSSLRLLRDPVVRRLFAAFMIASIAWGATVSFLPLTLTQRGLASAAAFLLVSGIARAGGRWGVGFLSDRGVRADLVRPASLLVIVAGLLLLAAAPGAAAAVLVSAAAYGTGLGIFQTLMLLGMMERVRGPHFGAVSGLWATALDSGGILGTGGLAIVAAFVGNDALLWAVPVVVLAALPFATYSASRY